MAAARLLDVGNCDFDHGSIRAMLNAHFDVQIEHVMFVDEATRALRQSRYDLVLVNRRIFADDSDGGALIRAMKSDPELSGVPVMLLSNFTDAQERAVADGARPGFGKASLTEPRTVELLSQYLPRLRPATVGAPPPADVVVPPARK